MTRGEPRVRASSRLADALVEPTPPSHCQLSPRNTPREADSEETVAAPLSCRPEASERGQRWRTSPKPPPIPAHPQPSLLPDQAVHPTAPSATPRASHVAAVSDPESATHESVGRLSTPPTGQIHKTNPKESPRYPSALALARYKSQLPGPLVCQTHSLLQKRGLQPAPSPREHRKGVL